MLFSGQDNPQNCPSRWDLDPHLIHGSFGRTSQFLKRHLDRFNRFCTAELTTVPNTHT